MTASDIALRAVTIRADLEQIAGAWLDLHLDSEPRRFCQDPYWCLRIWDRLEATPGRRPAVVVGCVEGRIRLIWPLVTFRSRLWRVTRGLSENLADYDDILVAEAAEADRWRRAAWDFAMATFRPDMMMFRRIAAGSGLDRVIPEGRTAWQRPSISLYVDFRGEMSWDSYFRTINKATRKSWRRGRNWLSRFGEIRYEAIDDPAMATDLIEWMLARKHERLGSLARSSREKTEAAAFARDIPFLREVARHAVRTSQMTVLRLCAGEHMVAIDTVLTGGRRAVGWLHAYDQRFLPAAPGHIVCTESLAWARAQGYDLFDLMPEPEPYKRQWTDRSYPVRDVRVAATGWGKVLVTWHRSSLRTIALGLYMRAPRPIQIAIRRLFR
ncbi:MAG: GNAT family N-acetyltransferase [Alphaproteobacteria bacterium]